MSLIQSISKIALTPSVVIGNAITGVLGIKSKQSAETLSKTGFGQALGTSIAAVGAGLAIVSAPAGSVGAAAKSLVPKTVTGKILAAGAVGVVAQSEVLKKQVVTADPIKFTGDIANIIDSPSGGNIATLFKNNPLLTVVTGGALVGAAGAAALPAISNAVSNALTRNEMKKQTDAFERQANAAEALIGGGANLPTTSPESTADNVLPTDTSKINTPATQSLTPKKTSRKGARRRVQPSIRQSVRVNVVNTKIGTTSKRYLNYAVVPN